MPGAWWTIPEEAILDALRRAANGEDPDMIYAEMYANCDHESPDDT